VKDKNKKSMQDKKIDIKKIENIIFYFSIIAFCIAIFFMITNEKVRPDKLINKFDKLKTLESSISSLKREKITKDIELEAYQRQLNDIMQKKNTMELKNFNMALDIPSILVFLEQTANNNNLTISINTYMEQNVNPEVQPNINNDPNNNLNNNTNNKLNNNLNNNTNINSTNNQQNNNTNNNIVNKAQNAINQNNQNTAEINKNINQIDTNTANNQNNNANNSNNTLNNNQNNENVVNNSSNIIFNQIQQNGIGELALELKIKGKYTNIRKFIKTIDDTNYIKVTKFTIKHGEDANIIVKFIYYNK